MDKTLQAEAIVIDRMLDMLEEGSVTVLMKQDKQFARYIGNIYDSLGTKFVQLRSQSVSLR